MTRSVMLAYLGFGLSIIRTPQTINFGVAYSFTFGHFGGVAPYVMSLSGSLPSGITYTDNGNGTGTLAGTTSAPGAFPITIQLTDGNRTRVAGNYTLNVVPLPLSLSGHLPDQTIGVAITPYTYTASGGYGGYSYAVTSGALPTGLSLNGATGQITGTPSAAGAYSWAVTVTDSNGGTATHNDSCSVGYVTLTLTGTATSPAIIGASYSWTPTTTGGSGSGVVYSLGSGTLPAGTSLNTSTGNVSGTITGSATTYTFVIHAVDATAGMTANSPTETVVSGTVTTWDPTFLGVYLSLSNSNRTVTANTASFAWNCTRSTTTRSSGKQLFEIQATAAGGVTGDWMMGLCDSAQQPNVFITSNGGDAIGDQANYPNQYIRVSGALSSGYLAGSTGTSAIGSNGYTQWAVDFSAGKGWISDGPGTGWIGGGNPDTGTTPTFIFTSGTALYICGALDASSTSLAATLNVTGSFALNPGHVTSFSPWG